MITPPSPEQRGSTERWNPPPERVEAERPAESDSGQQAERVIPDFSMRAELEEGAGLISMRPLSVEERERLTLLLLQAASLLDSAQRELIDAREAYRLASEYGNTHWTRAEAVEADRDEARAKLNDAGYGHSGMSLEDAVGLVLHVVASTKRDLQRFRDDYFPGPEGRVRPVPTYPELRAERDRLREAASERQSSWPSQAAYERDLNRREQSVDQGDT